MMPGVFSTVFQRESLEAVLDAVVDAGFRATQFHMTSAGVDLMPERVAPELATRVRKAFEARGLRLAALSGTFNSIHPDRTAREAGFRRLEALAAAATGLGAGIITLCSGTMDAGSMWRAHPGNGSPEAWRAMVEGMARAAAIGERHGVMMAFEPEVSNVIDSARKARQALDEVGSSRLKVCIDGANLYHKGELPRMDEILDEAFDLLGRDIVIAHAKDVSKDGEAGHDAAGTGLLDYDAYIGHLGKCGFGGAVVLHSLSEAQVPGCREFLMGKLGRET